MYNPYNSSNLEASFSSFLLSGNNKVTPVSVKNYLSDLRYFLQWLATTVSKENKVQPEIPESEAEFIQNNITDARIAQYKASLLEGNTPPQTLNRRLSTLRRFCDLCISQGWLKENPARKVQNAKRDQNASTQKASNKILNDFKLALLQAKSNKAEAELAIRDVEEFLNA